MSLFFSVDHVGDAESPDECDAVSTRRSRKHTRATPFGQLDRNHSNISTRAVDDYRLTPLQPESVNTLQCSKSLDPERACARKTEPLRDMSNAFRWDRDVLGIESTVQMYA
jgi:hypothetical protein